MNFLLDVDRRRVHYQIAPILLILATPYQLRIQITVAPLVRDAQWVFRILLNDALVFGGRYVQPFCFVVDECLDRLGAGRGLGFSHCYASTSLYDAKGAENCKS